MEDWNQGVPTMEVLMKRNANPPRRLPDDDSGAAARRERRRLAPPPLQAPPQEVLARLHVDANGFTFDPVTGMTYTLSPNGVRIVRGLAAGGPLAQLAAEIAADCGITPERALLDAERFVGELRREFLPGESNPRES